MFFTTSGRRFRCTLATLIILQFTLSHGLGIESINIDEYSPTYVDISWEIVAGSSWDYYSVDCTTTSGNNVNGYPTNTTDMSHRVTGLRPDTEYTLTVTPWTTEVRGDSLNETITTEAIAEGEILVFDVTSSSVFIQWRPVDEVNYYAIDGDPSDAVIKIPFITATEVTLSIKLPGTVFNVTVKGDGVNMLASTQIRSGPEAVVNISIERIDTDNIILSWTPPSSPYDGYELYYSAPTTNRKALITTVQRSDNITSYDWTVPDLTPSTNYIVEVGTYLDADGLFPLQRSVDNPMATFETDPAQVDPTEMGPGQLDSTQTGSPQSTGGAYFPALHYMLFFVPLLAVFLA